MGIVSWVVLGTIVGILVNWLLPEKFPGRRHRDGRRRHGRRMVVRKAGQTQPRTR
jgi:hypothetical protein